MEIKKAIETEVKDDQEHLVVLASGNDVGELRPSQIKVKYKELIINLKNNRKCMSLAGVIPRKIWSQYLKDQGKILNNELKQLCQENKVNFIDLWDKFPLNDTYFSRDGIHLNGVGNSRLGRLLDEGFLTHLASLARDP